jgi:hypothetical protein
MAGGKSSAKLEERATLVIVRGLGEALRREVITAERGANRERTCVARSTNRRWMSLVRIVSSTLVLGTIIVAGVW